MGLEDIQDKISETWDSFKNWCADFWEKTKAYFQSLDQWEWVGWGGEAVGLILVIIALVLW
jgi:hypothetical protein